MGSILLLCVLSRVNFSFLNLMLFFHFLFELCPSCCWLQLMYLTLLQLFCQLTNWFMFYCFNRTLSNSLETVLTLVGLYYWPCMRVSAGKVHPVSRKWGLAVAALACAIRPTSAIIWLYVGLLELLVTRDRLRFVFLEVLPIGQVLIYCSLM